MITQNTTKMRDIDRLHRVPISLLKAKNVSYIVIDGMTLEKKMMIEKAQREAKEILKDERYLSRSGIKELTDIMDL